MDNDFQRFTHPCVVIDLLADVWGDFLFINTPTDVMIDTLSGEKVDSTTDVVPEISNGVLIDVKENVLVAAMSAFSFAISTP